MKAEQENMAEKIARNQEINTTKYHLHANG